jgi:putative membrane protein (TIGR04086 family)
MPLLYGLAWALFYAAVGTLAIALWAHFGSAGKKELDVAAYLVHCLAVVCGAFTSSRAAAVRGWYHGGATGLCYALLMMFIGLVLYHDPLFISSSALLRTCIITLIGAFAGIIGVNTVSDR